MLYPIVTETRAIVDLSGFWRFKLDEGDGEGFAQKWYEKPFEGKVYDLPVPASFNELMTTIDEKEHYGYIWYQKDFMVPSNVLSAGRAVLRFGSATHKAVVWVNGTEVARHFGGFLPFEAEIGKLLHPGYNRVTVALDNRLDETTLPLSNYETRMYLEDGKEVYVKRQSGQNYGVDFYNFSGLHRPVKIYTTPENYIEDIVIVPHLAQGRAYIDYRVKTSAEGAVRVTVLDAQHQPVATANGDCGTIDIPDAQLWEPGHPYLYELEAELACGGQRDVYYEPFGVRTVEVRKDRFYINGKSFYFKGFSRHEDSNYHGKGLDEVLNTKDYSLMKWCGCNAFRTSHYPYSEEMMRQADRKGFVVINEVPAVGLSLNFDCYNAGSTKTVQPGQETWRRIQVFDHHQQVLRELIDRDKNHPCVVMWSIANQPALEEDGCYGYFKPLFDLARSEDPQRRPITIAFNDSMTGYRDMCEDMVKVFEDLDAHCFNIYFGWYSRMGDVHRCKGLLVEEINRIHAQFGKPILFTEYGADTIAGLHDVVPSSFSEEYQSLFYEIYAQAFDECPGFIGELPWNFADFATDQCKYRAGGNRKGLFTRERKPKMAASTLRARWTKIPHFGYKE